MDSAVSHENEKPIYYKRDLFFTRLVVDRVKVDMLGHQLDYTVYYAGTSKYSFSIVQTTTATVENRYTSYFFSSCNNPQSC